MRRSLSHIMIYVLTVAVGGGFVSCGSSKRTATAGYRYGAGYTLPDKNPVSSQMPPGDSRSLVAEAEKWLGVPYRYGGNDRDGVDCSGLMVNVYSRALNIKLPRNSAKQNEFCSDVDRGSLEPGDLVFFDTSRERNGKVSHVGMYIGDGRMIHSSTSKGVIVSGINDNYYAERFLAGGRVMKRAADETQNRMPEAVPTASPLPFRYVEVDSKHELKATPNQPATENADRELTPDDARSKVLNSLIENKIDSIFAVQAMK